jgi:glycosyltransferase involved in cell wall biosynthesis
MTDASLTYYEPSGLDEFTSGHNDAATSRDRALNDDASGRTAYTQRAILSRLAVYGARGSTSIEARLYLDLPHGSTSSACTNLHRDGRIARLDERRHGAYVYVLPSFVEGRPTVPPTPSRSRRAYAALDAIARLIDEAEAEGTPWIHTGSVLAVLDEAGS